MSTTMRLVYITTKDEEQAQAIGRELVTRRLAACVNIIPAMTSIYPWAGALETSREAVLIAKTDASKTDALIAAVRTLHSYDVPCALVLPVLGGNQAYLEWLQDQIK